MKNKRLHQDEIKSALENQVIHHEIPHCLIEFQLDAKQTFGTSTC